jgi:hypothetical protein
VHTLHCEKEVVEGTADTLQAALNRFRLLHVVQCIDTRGLEYQCLHVLLQEMQREDGAMDQLELLIDRIPIKRPGILGWKGGGGQAPPRDMMGP